MGEAGRNSVENGEMDVGSSQRDAVEPRVRSYLVKVNENGCLSVPPALVGKLGLEPEAELEIVSNGERIEIRPNIHSLERVYIEPTSRCNLACRFSPCHVCVGCSLLEKNEEDCGGNAYPTCGGCLWAQGSIQCP